MRNIRIFAAAIMLAAIVAVSASAQTRPAGTTPARPATPAPATQAGPVPETKIAYINTQAFGDEKAGITRLVTKLKALEREFDPRQKELTTMNNRLKALADEISKLTGSTVVDPKTIQAKQDEAEQIQRDLKYKKEMADADFAKRYEQELAPISKDIRDTLNQFAAARGITMLLDISKFGDAILIANPGMDITQAFITEFNSRPATASAGTGTR